MCVLFEFRICCDHDKIAFGAAALVKSSTGLSFFQKFTSMYIENASDGFIASGAGREGISELDDLRAEQ